MYQRFTEKLFLKSVKTFPVVILTGARQTGKSTLCKMLLEKTHQYVSLEDPDIRRQALEDPRTFLENFPAPVIFDEIQYAPQLPSYIQGIVDAHRTRYGQYILTGSQNFLMMQHVSQSLAGRAAVLTLYPCSIREVDGKKKLSHAQTDDIADWILRGGYPELRSRPELDRNIWCASYIRLYLERDIRQILNVTDLTLFERFLRLVAIRTGQILNMSDLARDTGISVPTVRRWLSILQASYQVYLLEPFHINLSKRLVKAPKIYFADTALASYLMGIHDPAVLNQGLFLGPLFETAVVLEHLKWASFSGEHPAFSYFRTNDGLEVDLFIETGGKIHAREIKTSRTLNPLLAAGLLKTEALLQRPLEKCLLAPVERASTITQDVILKPWHHVEW
ncbi:MAG: ATP-binding protein [Patescibacteria group bacterium]